MHMVVSGLSRQGANYLLFVDLYFLMDKLTDVVTENQ